MFYVYILKSLSNQSLYIGSTNNLKRRLEEHNSGKSFYTKSRSPYRLAYYEAYTSAKEAKHREENLKLRANAFNQLMRRIGDSLKT